MVNPEKLHWEKIYSTKKPGEVSWTEEIPSHSLLAIEKLKLPPDAHIADIGGGDSKLVDHLIARGYRNLTVVDISGESLKRAQKRLGPLASKVHWVEEDITHYKPASQVDLWHDRAAFHFLIQQRDIEKYVSILEQHVKGYVLLATFSTNGPDKCSGLPVKQYSAEGLTHLLQKYFKKFECNTYIHTTPAGVEQEFLSCCFSRKQ